MKITTLAIAFAALTAPAYAQDAAAPAADATAPAATETAALQGDAAAGEEQFGRQCVACHVVQDPATDEVLAGRNAQVGPNLYGVAGRVAGSVEGYAYGDGITEYGETGAVWEEANFVAYVQDPTGFLRETLDNNRARGKMAYQVRDEAQAYDLYAYLATFGGDAAAAEPAATN